MRFHKHILATILATAFCTNVNCQEELRASEIVQEMAKQFRSAKTYEVAGSLKTVLNMRPYSKLTWGQALTKERLVLSPSLQFSFFFERPNKLRFDWLSIDHRVDRPLSIWTDGIHGFSWRPSSEEKNSHFVLLNHSELKMLLQDADFNQSSSMASILFSQLTGDARTFAFDEMKQAEIVREEIVDGKKCYVILGTISDDPWSVWVEKSTFILLKMRLQISLNSFDDIVATGKQNLTIGEVSLTQSKLNAQLPISVFSYRPKLRKKDIDISK